jgi:hypothetical protein
MTPTSVYRAFDDAVPRATLRTICGEGHGRELGRVQRHGQDFCFGEGGASCWREGA